MKKLFNLTLFSLLSITFLGCAPELFETVRNENATFNYKTVSNFRLENNSSSSLKLEVYDVYGSLLSHKFDISPGSVLEDIQFPADETTFLVSNGKYDRIVVLDLKAGKSYSLEMDSNNNLVQTENVLNL